MLRMKRMSFGVLALVVGVSAACEDNLVVTNLNNPDLTRLYAKPTDIEGVAGTLYRTYHQATAGAGEGLSVQSKLMSGESYGTVANFGMQLRAGVPRVFIANQRANSVAAGNNANFSTLSRLQRTSGTVIQSIDKMVTDGKTMGSPARNTRARAFAFMANGLAMGTLALGYDSLAIARPALPASVIPALIGPQAAMDTALMMLDSAIALITSATGADGEIPSTWMAGFAYTQADLVRLIRTYKAKLRAGVARTKAQRDAVDWALVVADATAGITADHNIGLQANLGWTSGLDAATFMSNTSWHQVTLLYNGMADTSGAYQNYVNRPYPLRTLDSVLVLTPDRRWPAGNTRPIQQANSAIPMRAPTASLRGQYFRNRTETDQADASNPWGASNYDHRRWRHIADNNGTGVYAFLPKTENDMLAAEGMLRPGPQQNLNSAMVLVNAHRALAGLAAFTTPGQLAPGTDGTPDGPGCVPRLPNGTCGTLWEAMKYEKRMETQLTGYMQWFIDSRGWGDLIVGTALHWPVPYQESDTRNIPFYNMPSAGTLGGAPLGTYGF